MNKTLKLIPASNPYLSTYGVYPNSTNKKCKVFPENMPKTPSSNSMRPRLHLLIKDLLNAGALLLIVVDGASIALYPTIQKMDAEVRKPITAHQIF